MNKTVLTLKWLQLGRQEMGHYNAELQHVLGSTEDCPQSQPWRVLWTKCLCPSKIHILES